MIEKQSKGWGGGAWKSHLFVNKSVLTLSSTDDSPWLNQVILIYHMGSVSFVLTGDQI